MSKEAFAIQNQSLPTEQKNGLSDWNLILTARLESLLASYPDLSPILSWFYTHDKVTFTHCLCVYHFAAYWLDRVALPLTLNPSMVAKLKQKLVFCTLHDIGKISLVPNDHDNTHILGNMDCYDNRVRLWTHSIIGQLLLEHFANHLNSSNLRVIVKHWATLTGLHHNDVRNHVPQTNIALPTQLMELIMIAFKIGDITSAMGLPRKKNCAPANPDEIKAVLLNQYHLASKLSRITGKSTQEILLILDKSLLLVFSELYIFQSTLNFPLIINPDSHFTNQGIDSFRLLYTIALEMWAQEQAILDEAMNRIAKDV